MRKALALGLTGCFVAAACAPDAPRERRDLDTARASVNVGGPCPAGLDYAGYCDGQQVVWCEGGLTHSAQCDLQGEVCAWESDAIGYSCVPPSGGSACGDVDYAGYCDGSTLVWCESSVLQKYDCAADGLSCGYQDAQVGHNCISEGGGGGAGLLTVGQILDGHSYGVTQDYGYTNFDGGYSYCHSYGNWNGALVHCGVDIGVVRGTPLRAPGNGVVTVAGGTPYYQDAYNYAAGDLRIRLDNGAEVLLGHSSEIYVGVGASVGKGALVGASGTQNGDHLHLEVRVPDGSCSSGYCTVDPMSYFGW
jgi:hypothetical protein